MITSVNSSMNIDSISALIMGAATQTSQNLSEITAQLQNNPNLSPEMQIQMQQLMSTYTNQMTMLSSIVKEFSGVGKTIANNFSF